MSFEYDLTYNDFNPTVFYVSKNKKTADGTYHDHDYTELHFILSGKGKYLLDGIEHEVETGDVVFCNPGIKHKHIVYNQNEPLIKFIAGFTNFHFKNMPANTIDFTENDCIVHTTSELRQEISMLCHSMIAEKECSKAGKYFMIKSHLMQMLLLIVRELSGNDNIEQKGCNIESYNKSYAVNRIISYLNEKYEHKISLEQIAHNMYLSPVYISKIFKEETGESPINYLIKIRLEKAKDILLSDDGDSIKNVANRVGYDDVYHFSKLFKKYYGISPLYYRKNAIQQNISNK